MAVVMSQCIDFSPPERNKVAFVEVAVSGGSTVPKVEFHRPPKANESDQVSIKKTQDDATIIHLVDKKLSIHYRKQKKVLFEPALFLLKVLNSCTKWVFSMIGQYEFCQF